MPSIIDMSKTVLFICTGNYYRSRYAEIYFNHLAPKMGLDWKAFSRGLEASAGRNEGPISRFALKRLAHRELSPGDPPRFPIQLEEQDLQEAGLIVAINRVEHQPMMHEYFPSWVGKIMYWDVADLNITDAENALPVLEERIHSLLEDLRSNSQNQS